MAAHRALMVRSDTLSVLDGARVGLEDREGLVAIIGGFLDGDASLTGLELYYELERRTPLLSFHTFLRSGPRNRDHHGLQQSYGDHNRLLMLGLDKLLEGDLDWYRSRLAVPGDVPDRELLSCFDAIAGLEIGRDERVALWLAAALHDCGMLAGRGASVDVEDGIVLGHDVLADLCPAGLVDLATVVLRHHDYVKGLFLGEVPPALLADDLEGWDARKRGVAMAGLGMVQVAGAASLGTGRLEPFRMEIWRSCRDDGALGDRSPLTRLARLLATQPHAAPPPADRAVEALDRLTPAQRPTTERFLSRVALHGWQRSMEASGPEERMVRLVDVVEAWSGSGADHVVLEGAPTPGPAPDRGRPACRVETALSGARLLVLEG